MLSNKLTFSLASLVVLLAVGLVFAPMAAFAQTVVDSITVESSPGNGYVAADTIDIRVTFGNDVTLSSTGDTKLNFMIGTTSKVADWQTGNNADEIDFQYTVAVSDEGPLSIGANAIDLQNAATITAVNAANDPVSTDHAAPDIDGAFHNVDAVAPRITNAAFTNTGPYGEGDDIEVSLTFSEPVTVPAANRANVTLNLEVGAQTRMMILKGSSMSTSTLMFSYPVMAMETDEDGVQLQILTGSPDVQYIDDAAGNDLFQHVMVESGGMVDTTAPALASTVITSTGPYGSGAVITVTLTFDEAVIVDTSTGIPYLTISVGNVAKLANYAGGSGTMMLMFSYLVQAGDMAPNGVAIAASALQLNGATIEDATGNDAGTPTNAAVSAAAAHAVDGSMAGTTDPGTTDPGTTDPGTTDPGTTDPGTTDPGTTDPGTMVPDGEASATADGLQVSFPLSAEQLGSGNFIVIATWPALAELISSASYSLIDITSGTVDLEDFFTFGGGTIQLLGPTGSTPKDVVISEIMWGSNTNHPPGTPDRTSSQWIELYVSTGGTSKGTVAGATDGDTSNAPATDGDWMITLTKGSAAPAAPATGMIVVDEMSNQGLGRWNALDGNHGSNGRTRYITTENTVVNAVPFVSMYRNIAYADVTGLNAPKKKRAEQLDAIPDGTRSASWKEDDINRGAYQGGLRYATPGEEHVSGIIEEGVQALARDSVVFNEVANRSEKAHDWIELHNKKTASVSIKNWTLSIITSAPTATDTEAQLKAKDATIVKFATDDNDDITIPGGGYLVVVNTDPASTSLAVGQNVGDPNAAPQGVSTLYYVDADLDLPKTGFTLILRTEEKASSHEKIADVIVGTDGYFRLIDDDPAYRTAVWPLQGTEAGAKDDLGENDDVTWVRDHAQALFHGDEWKNVDAPSKVTGVGIDRNATAFNSGTPGYANDAVQGEFADADGKAKYTGMISISEIMVDQTKRNLPQWIELFNNSRTQAVNIKDWKLKILNVNSADLDARVNSTLKINGDLVIAPSQTVLIVSAVGRHSRDSIPSSSTYNLHAEHKKTLEMTSQRDSVLSTEGFYISLSDARDVVADEAGNIDGSSKTDDAPAWALPTYPDGRSSLIRRYLGDGIADDGTTAEGWILAAMTNLVPQTYYGDPDDMSSPGDRKGSPLPVSLSSFRPMRDKATGAVVIRWITQSELNNAGFNILRSETKKGEFKVVNLKGIIAGHGTTSEKHVYEWTDTSAKPNVVYFYQIEDVSLDGKRTTLRTTHLRGNVNAAGKATTTWADLKSQR